MTLDKIERKIENLLSSDKRWPVIIDFSNKKDMESFLHHFNVGKNEILSAGKFCGKDGIMKLEELANCIENSDGYIFLVHLTAYLKLYGENVLKNTLKTILSKSIKGHVVIITYQCQNYLKFSDGRFAERGQIHIVDGEVDEVSSISLISPALTGAFLSAYEGFEKVGEAFETSNDNMIYIATDVSKQTFNMSLINIKQLNSGYDLLCSRDSRISNIPEGFGNAAQWNNLLKTMGSTDLPFVVKNEFGSMTGLVECVKQYPNYADEKKWLYYIALEVFGKKNNSYLNHVIASTTSYKDIPRALYRTILTMNKSDEDFSKMYAERRDILKSYTHYLNEVVDYCKVIASKQEDAIYYLTDLTQLEKEKVIDWLDIYGNKYTTNELVDILNIVYPDLATYLSHYRFKKDWLNDYFECYKYQKVVNKILPSFEDTVKEQASELGFVSVLQPRTQIFDKIDLAGAHTFFFDALGVEYLGFIQAKCNEYNLSANISYGRSELPSLTSFNKDFMQVCNSKGCPVSDIKDLDEIKHHGEDGFDYEKTKTPIYLIRELEIIDDLLQKIQVAILNEKYEKAIIVSDHGASRLAVLHETENIWQMETKGIHSGRCCPINEINNKPDFAIEESGYWVLANYDRFKGSRKANVEVHGGATLEEVTVPIIEITRKLEEVEAFILDEYKIISLAALEIPVLKIYVGIVSNNIVVKVSDKYYDAVPTGEKYIYEIRLENCTRKGKYSVEILNGSNILSNNNIFEIKKKGFTEVSLFD